MSSEDYGRDLTGVQNLRKKHKRLEAELGAHEPAIQVSLYLGLVLTLLLIELLAVLSPEDRGQRTTGPSEDLCSDRLWEKSPLCSSWLACSPLPW